MGVRFARRYLDITRDLTSALQSIEDVYAFAQIPVGYWNDMTEDERHGCMQTLTDDVFYALGVVPVLRVGGGWVRYNSERHVITVTNQAGCTQIVSLT